MWSKKAILFYANRYGYESALELMYLIDRQGFLGTGTEYNILCDDIMEAVYNTGRQ